MEMWSLKLFGLLLAMTTLIFSNAGSLQRSSRCYIPPTVEGCSIIRRKWSFVNATGSCELNFVCSKHSNAFLTKEECESVCQPVAGPKQPQRDDCAYWIQNLDQCRFKRETFYPDRFGLRQRVLLFRFCGPSSWKLYAYYFRSGECAVSGDVTRYTGLCRVLSFKIQVPWPPINLRCIQLSS